MKKLYLVLAGMLLASSLANASIITYSAILNPVPTGSGSGTAVLSIDDVLNQLTIDVSFTGLSGTTTASHIHAPTTVAFTGTAGVATQTPTFTGFPLGVTSGTYHHVFDLTAPATYNAAFVTANGGTAASAETAFLADLKAGKAYLNVHTSTFPGGEINGFFVATPEPGTASLLVLAGAGLVFARRRHGRA